MKKNKIDMTEIMSFKNMLAYKCKPVVLLFLFMCFGLVSAQEPLSLNDAIARALENNYDLTLTRQDQQIAEIRNSWGAAGRYPYVNLSVGANHTYNMNDSENYLQSRYSAGVNIGWTLFDGFSVRINKQKFDELEQLSKQNTAIVVEGTIQSVILAYYSVLLEKEQLAVAKELMDLSEDRYEQVKQRQEFGSAVTFDVLQAQNAYLGDKTRYLLQEVAYKNSLRDLNYIMVAEEGQKYDLTSDFVAQPVEYKLADLHQQMLSDNKALKNQYINQNLLENAVVAAKSSYYPSLDLSAGGGLTRLGNDFEVKGASWDNTSNMYGNLTLSYNLFSGGSRKRALQIAEIEQKSGQVELMQMQHELTNKLDNLYELYLVRKELLTVARENLEAARLNLQIAGEKFDSGAINSFNFRDVQLVYLNAAQQELQAIYNFIDTHTSLLRMTGAIIQQYE